jgi:hypothetical protein
MQDIADNVNVGYRDHPLDLTILSMRAHYQSLARQRQLSECIRSTDSLTRRVFHHKFRFNNIWCRKINRSKKEKPSNYFMEPLKDGPSANEQVTSSLV